MLTKPEQAEAHTPGPLVVSEGSYDRYDVRLPKERGGRTVAGGCKRPDAVLFSAAPELLSALQGARQWLQLLCDEADIDPEETAVDFGVRNRETGERRDVGKITLAFSLAKCDAAIKKATGQ